MSADLFAEFGFGEAARRPSETERRQPVKSKTNTLIPDLNAFEDAVPFNYSNQLDEPSSRPTRQEANRTQSHLFDDFDDFQQPQFGNGNEILFDASLEKTPDDESDDWGEFESAESTSTQHQLKVSFQAPRAKTLYDSTPPTASSKGLSLIDTLSIEDKSPPTHSRSPGTLQGNNPSVKGIHTPSRPTIPVQDELYEEWGDFTDGPSPKPSQASVSQISKAPGTSQSASTPDNPAGSRIPLASGQKTDPAQVRPTNIPPPSILLGLFPQLFERLRQEGAEAKRNAQSKDSLETVALSIIYTLKAAARVVSGRTLRWKRDAILSQSMRIGPARSGKVGGMKLSTVNKNETIKEQQEAVDVITMWRDRAAFFNSIIQAAGSRPIQVILENTRVSTQQGALKASHACALCGLKRDERLPKIDENVEDSFGEWWTEHWGHTDCRHFWEANMALLNQR